MVTHPELYGINICYSHFDKLVKLNNKLSRILQHKDSFSPVQDLYVTYNTLPIVKLHNLYLLLFVHKCIHHVAALPCIFNNYFVPNSTVHSHKTGQSDQLHLLTSNTEYGQRCLTYKGNILLNNLPRNLQQNANTHQFMKQIKNYLTDILICMKLVVVGDQLKFLLTMGLSYVHYICYI